MKSLFGYFLTLVLLSSNSILTSFALPSERRSPEATRCEALAGTDLSGILDAPTQITESKLVERDGDLPAYCLVRGYVAPQVGFVLYLPVANWNGKLLEHGTGGSGGVLDIPTAFFFGEPLRKGYACVFSDGGHQGLMTDGLWALNNLQTKIDWAYRSPHVTLLAANAIAERFYGKAPSRAYFIGGSTGGRQALIEAERFPWDFNGIIALWPAVNEADTLTSLLWNYLAMTDKDGKPLLSAADCQFVNDAVVAKFDMSDGVKDELIGDPRSCHFDLKQLLQKDAQGRCLTPTQVEAVRKVWAGPSTASGKKLYDGCARPVTDLRPILHAVIAYKSLIENFFRYMAFIPDAGSNWKLTDFDFERDYKRLMMTNRLYEASDPDLGDFKAAGGKLMIIQGWDDESPPPLETVNFYEKVERVMGGPDATRDFCRLYMLPGVSHGGRGDGAADIDYLSYLEAWVEQGHAPDRLIAAHVSSDNWADHVFPVNPDKVTFTRPVYPYPTQARFMGSGNPNDAASFKRTQP